MVELWRSFCLFYYDLYKRSATFIWRNYYNRQFTPAILQTTEIGKIAEQEWLKTPSVRPDMNIELDEFIIMPNHFHAIIRIGENHYNRVGNDGRDAMHRVSTASNQHRFGSQTKNLSSIVRGYKSAVTIYARKNNIEFDWQSRFHDHIIKNEESYLRIKNYIINNPNNWKEDGFYNK